VSTADAGGDTPETIYDYPRYYDILFGWDRSKEAAFYDSVLAARCSTKNEPVLEVACGPGRIAALLAERGWNVTGLDLRPAMLAFLRQRCAASGLRVGTLLGDMTSFRAPSRFAAAYNPLSSFRLLSTDDRAEAHLGRVAEALRPGGVYVLDLEFVANVEEPSLTTDEDWEMTADGITVRARNEAVEVIDDGVRRLLAWGDEGHLRGYTSAAFERLVAAAGRFSIESWHPEWSRATGVSEFRIEHTTPPPVAGRAMVVLSRT
jgi:SAM-dependent methyltransferase